MELDFIGWLTPRWRVLFDNMPDSFDGCSILDVGCGQGVLGFLIKHNYYLDKFVMDGVDGYNRYIYNLSNMRIYDSLSCNDVLEHLENAIDYDYIFCLDVLEHNDKKYSYEVLKNMLEITQKKLYVTVPNEEPLENPKRGLAWSSWREESDNKYKGHVSKWGVDDFPYGKNIVFDNRKGLTKTMRMFDSLRRFVFGVDWNESHILSILDGDLNE